MESRSNGLRLPPPWITPAAGKVDREVRPVIGVQRRRPGSRLWTFDQVSTAIWLDATQSSTITAVSGAASQWNDAKSNGKNATQGTATQKPTYSNTGFNGKPGMLFNGGNSMAIPALSLSTAATLFIVFSVISDNYYTAVASNNGSVDRFVTGGGTYPGLFRTTRIENLALGMPTSGNLIISINANSASSYTIRKNGVQVYSGGLFTFASNILGIGGDSIPANPATGLNGAIAEMAILPYSASAAEVDLGEGSLAWKWGLEGTNLPAGHPYKSAAPTI